jgi:Flp pilus assembly protein TadD
VPEDFEAMNNLGIVFARLGKRQEADVCFKAALDIHPGYAKALVNLGDASLEEGDPSRARDLFSRALLEDGRSVEAHLGLGRLLLREGKIKEAKEHFETACAIQPKNREAQEALKAASVLENMGTAVAKVTDAIAKDPRNVSLYVVLGTLYKARGDMDGAMKEYEKALTIAPEHAGALTNLAVLAMNGREYDKAHSLLERALRNAPDNIAANYNMVCLLAKENRPEESLAWLAKTIALGFNEWRLLQEDKDLDNLRGTREFQEILQRCLAKKHAS